MWTDERVELLKKLWADGLSASRIAAELGGITRNAVIGKVHRLGLSGRAKTPSSSVSRPRKARSSIILMLSWQLYPEDREWTGTRQVILECDFPQMGIGDVQVTAADRETVRPGKF